MKGKKRINIILYVCLFVSIIGILFFNNMLKDRFPQNGIYILNNKGYYVFNNSEEKKIALIMYYVNNKLDKDPTLINQYSNFRMITSDNKEYPFRLNDEQIKVFENISNDTDRDNIIEQTIYIDLESMNFSLGLVELIGIKYDTEKKKDIYEPFGLVEVDFVATDDHVTALSNRVSWMSYVQPTFTYVEYLFENYSDKQIEIKEIYYGQTGVEIVEASSILLNPKDNKEIKYEIKLRDEETGKHVLYALKPKVIYSENGLEKPAAVANTSLERYVNPELELKEYLYKKSK